MFGSARNSKLASWLLVGVFAATALHVFVLHPTPVLAADAAPASDDAPIKREVESSFMWVVRSSGWIGAFILVLSIYFVATIVKLFMELREEVTAPPALVQQCNAMLEQRNVQGLYDGLKEDDAYFSRTLVAGIAELPHGLEEARDAAERQADALTVEMEKKISMLAVLGTLGPMIGLLGTLLGMIESFSVIETSGARLDASEVAGGISKALVLTFEGVLLSVPAIWFYAFFRNRVSTLSVNGLLLADDFLRRINRLTRARTAAPGAARTPANA